MNRILLVILLILAGCGNRPPERLSLLLDWVPNPNHIPLFVGKTLGYFEEEGIELDILKLLDPPAAIPYLAAGQVDLIVYYMPYTLLALAEQKDLRVLGVLIEEPLDGMILASEEGAYSEKTLGIYPGSRMAKYVGAVLKEGGVQFKEIKKMQLDPVSCLRVMDAVAGVYWNIEPFQLEAAQQKGKFIRFTDLGVPRYHELLILTNESVLNKKPKLKGSFPRALQKSIDYCRENPEEAFAIYLEKCSGKSSNTKGWEKKAWEATLPLFAKTQELDPEIFSSFIDWLEDKGVLDKGSAEANLLLGF